jgi:hypothetical protein
MIMWYKSHIKIKESGRFLTFIATINIDENEDYVIGGSTSLLIN